VVKELSRHPVNGEIVHVDLLRVRLDQPIEATVVLDLVGAENAPGVKEGGVLEQVTRELTIEALPGDIPDALHHDVTELQVGDTLTISALTPPRGVMLVDDADTVIATVTAPRLQLVDESEIEEEVQLVGEGETPAEEEAAEAADEAQASSEE
jgi:large subunit ribosomal protein L25